MYYINWNYFIMVMPAVILAMVASSAVNRTFQKYSRQMSQRNISGARAARMVLDANGLQNVQIEHIGGELTDHYDPSANVVRLSDSVYNNTSTASIGVACHEVGHAIQHAQGYVPVKIRMAIIPATNIGAKLSVPMIIIGVILSAFSQVCIFIAYAGILLFALSTVFQLVTLPVEFNASHRALATIEQYGILDDSEIGGARRVLRAAAMTYVAALAVSLSQLLYFIMMVAGSQRRE